ncbi:zinc finger protein DZIP1L-like, partial [Carlito syrichta]|uniref:Zinc finger protein DZIP1L-like n=1 Tax=Carlito syrichta TaxID=1868482 RepID=A0A1U7UKW8_CARSF
MQSQAATAGGFKDPLIWANKVHSFQFQPRRGNINWRSISALDVDRVARELDVATLQAHVTGITFCNLEQEVCLQCGQAVDPALLKVLRLAQLTIEYLWHCQDCLSTKVAQQEGQLQASWDQQQRTQERMDCQCDKLKKVQVKSHQRGKMINTLRQLLMQRKTQGHHQCDLCDKEFVDVTSLRGHIQRRHADMAESGKQKKQEVLIEELQAKLQWTQEKLEAQREAERQRQLQESEVARQREIEAKKTFEDWKEKERDKLHDELNKFKISLREKFKRVANLSSMLEQKMRALESHHSIESSFVLLMEKICEERIQSIQETTALRDKLTLQVQNEIQRQTSLLDYRKSVAQLEHEISFLQDQIQRQERFMASPGLPEDDAKPLTSIFLQILVLQTLTPRGPCRYLTDHPCCAQQLQSEIQSLQASLQENQRQAVAQNELINTLQANLQQQTRLINSLKRK